MVVLVARERRFSYLLRKIFSVLFYSTYLTLSVIVPCTFHARIFFNTITSSIHLNTTIITIKLIGWQSTFVVIYERSISLKNLHNLQREPFSKSYTFK